MVSYESGDVGSYRVEDAVLSTILMNPKTLEDLQAYGVKKCHFLSSENRILFQTVRQMQKEAIPIEVNTILGRLKELNIEKSVGGVNKILGLMDILPAETSAKHYSEMLKTEFARDKFQRSIHRSLSTLTKKGGGVKEAIEEMEVSLSEIGKDMAGSDAKGISTSSEILAEIQSDMDDGFTHGMAVVSGLDDIDLLLGGFYEGRFYIVAGRPAMGKTSLLMNILENVSTDELTPHPVGAFSLEMTAQELMFRMLCCRAGVSSRDLRTGKVTDEEMKDVQRAKEELSRAPIFIDESTTSHVDELCAKAKRMQLDHGIRAVFVDYLQLLSGGSAFRGENDRVGEITYISRRLKLLSRELGIPVIVASQLSRKVEGRVNRRPILSDLRDSGSIEQDADGVMMMYRDSYYAEGGDTPPPLDKVECNVVKHRHGPTGMIELRWIPRIVKFENMY